mmetsp:Transcript_6479/g.10259  ORF Transcript_6479/g.10259 Transcript_6479/m.10259 type:complete len:136 (-) Transcript_6479:219-626(-)
MGFKELRTLTLKPHSLGAKELPSVRTQSLQTDGVAGFRAERIGDERTRDLGSQDQAPKNSQVLGSVGLSSELQSVQESRAGRAQGAVDYRTGVPGGAGGLESEVSGSTDLDGRRPKAQSLGARIWQEVTSVSIII